MQIARHFLFLILIYFALTGLAYLLKDFFGMGIEFTDASILLTGALAITIFVSVLFFLGFKKNEQKSAAYTMSAIGLKFLLFLVLLGIYALFVKNLSIEFIVTFFVVYLTFTVYLLISFVKILKSKRPDL